MEVLRVKKIWIGDIIQTGLLAVLVAAVISSVLSWKLLVEPRNRFAASVEARAARASARFEEMKAREDTD